MDWEDTARMPDTLWCASVRPVPLQPPFTREQLEALGVKGVQFGSLNRIHGSCLSLDLCRFSDLLMNATEPGRICHIDQRAYFLHQDATQPLPFEVACFDWAYSEHFIEHIRLSEAIRWLKEVKRILRPGGLLRLSTPDLRRYGEGYVAGDDAFFAEHRRRMRGVGLPPMETRKAWMVNQIFRFWGHRWIYDLDELKHVVGEAGFSLEGFRERAFRQGRDPEVCRLDFPLRSDETIYVEVTA